MSFLPPAPMSEQAQLLFDDDTAELGYVMNASRLWAYQPETYSGIFDLLRGTSAPYGLGLRERGILVVACASSFGDSYCSLAWGSKLAAVTGAETAAAVLRGDDVDLSPREQAMAAWARAVTRDPNRTTANDVQALRDAGFTEAEIFAITAYVALRIAFSIVNDALGARPDAEYRALVPAPVLSAVTFGRSIDDGE